jgi:putative ABC transport system permease protein
VSPGYFETLGIRRLEGRVFDRTDIAGEPVAVVSRTLARRLWPAGTAIGQRLLAGGGRGDERPPWRTVVGVVSDVRQAHTDEDLADVYVALQRPGRFASVHVRTDGSPMLWLAPLRRAIRLIDPEASLDATGALTTIVDQQLARPRFLAGLLVVFGGFAVLLALLGVYGVAAYAARLREREIAVRMAVGATARHVTAMFLREGSAILVLGIAGGLFGATAIGRLLEAQLYGVTAKDPTTLAATALAFGAAGLAAAWRPARRAARTDPAVALRQE